MKKWTLMVSIVIVVVALIFSGCAQSPPPTTPKAPTAPATPAAPAKVFSWKMAEYRPPAQAVSQQWEIMAKKIKERSNGQLEIKLFTAGSLLNPKEQFTGVVDRIADLSSTVGSNHAGQVPLTSAQDLVFSFTTYRMGVDTIRGGLGELQAKEYLKYGVKPAMFYPSGALDFFSKFPVKVPQDLKGKLIRGAGGLQLKFYEMCGASTVQMSAGEVYQAMQTGTIDGFGLTDGTFASNRLYEVTKYAALMPIMIPLGIALMNIKSYEELSPNLQKILNDTFRETEDELIKAVEADDAKARVTMREKGMVVTQFTPQDLAPFKEIGMKTWDELVTKNPGTSAPEMLKIIKQFSK